MKSVSLALTLVVGLSLTSCATVDPIVARQNANIAAAPYVEAALTQPMSDLYQKAQAGDAHDAFRYGLALFSGRSWDPLLLPEDRAFIKDVFQRIEVARAQWQAQNPNPTSPFKWEEHVPLNAAETANLERLRLKLMPRQWIIKAATASVSRPVAIYMPPVTQGGAGRVQMMNVSDPVIGGRVIDAGIECVAKVREAVRNMNVRADLETITGVDMTAQAEALKIRDALARNAKIPGVAEDSGICGGPEPFARYGALLKSAYQAEKAPQPVMAPATSN